MPSRGTLPELPPLHDAAPQTPVLFLHGVLASPGNFGEAIRELAGAGVPVLAPAYGNRGTGDLTASLAELSGLLARELPAADSAFDIVGHSLGGLLGLRLAHHFPGRVRTLVGVGAAWRGVPLAPGRRGRIIRGALGLVGGPAYRQLLLTAPLEATAPYRTRVVSLVSDADRIIPPATASLGEVRMLRGVAHEHLPQQSAPILEALDWRP
ncbi:esterase/lipase family protein [Corynebacterium halotolerans]|uniref:esterase/lipase family protein n=1 Tax=Corynebacterium halotolerans TaxID=225326 RepID=UPI003CF29B02